MKYNGEQKIVFMHIPKTGGTTIFNLLSKHFKPSEICGIRHNTLEKLTDLGKYRLFLGHYSFEAINKYIPGDKILITFMRDPIERAISEYYFLRLHEDTGWPDLLEMHGLNWGGVAYAVHKSIAEFLNTDKNMDNPVLHNLVGFDGTDAERVCRAISVLDSFDFIGIFEDFERSISNMFKYLGFEQPSSIPHSMSFNELSKTMSKVEKKPLTVDEMRALNKHTELDRILYNHAKYLSSRRFMLQ